MTVPLSQSLDVYSYPIPLQHPPLLSIYTPLVIPSACKLSNDKLCIYVRNFDSNHLSRVLNPIPTLRDFSHTLRLPPGTHAHTLIHTLF